MIKTIGNVLAIVLWAAILVAAAACLSIYLVYLTAMLLMKTGGLF